MLRSYLLTGLHLVKKILPKIRYASSEVRKMKYILVTGGAISGIGKGVIASSLGTIFKAMGVQVTTIKIDPYINIDAGTFSPYEHGEVFVLNDGGEVDLDLGNYERFLDIKLTSDNNITTGKIYQHVINKERHGDYLGKTVQVVPHITDAVQEWVQNVAQVPVFEDKIPEICIIELGGTIGDIEGMPFIEAFRQFQFRLKKENFCAIHVSLVLQPRSTGEQKTKPTQASVRELRGLGISPDFIVCRSENEITSEVRAKISNFCQVVPEQVICVPDAVSLYHVPLILEEQKVIPLIAQQMGINLPTLDNPMKKWRDLAEKCESVSVPVTIGLVGKYTRLEDAYASVTKALQHASLHLGLKLKLIYIEAANLEPNTKEIDSLLHEKAWKNLSSCQGLLVPGGFGSRGIEGKLAAIEWARTNNKPFLGVCLGLQCAVIEFSRNVLGWKDANSTEVNPSTTKPVVIDMPEHNQGKMGGTMRLGVRQTLFKNEQSAIFKLYGRQNSIEERHRHRYEVNPLYVSEIEAAGMVFVAHDTTAERKEVMELENHPYFVGVQYHPEYISRPLCPSPPYLGLILASSGKLVNFLS